MNKSYVVIAYEEDDFTMHRFDNRDLAKAHLHMYAHYTEHEAILLDQYMNVIAQT